MSKVKFADVVSMMNNAVSGGFVGITNYVSEKGDVSSVVGHLGFSYEKAKQYAIDGITKAIKEGDFEPIIVSGNCYHDGTEFNSRKRSAPIKAYTLVYDEFQVREIAKEILNGWLNPKERENNKVSLSDKDNGLAFNTETGNFTFGLLVEKQTYKEEASQLAKDNMGICEKIEIKAPETKVKEIIRERFEKKFRTFTLASGKFESVSIAGNRFASDEITF